MGRDTARPLQLVVVSYHQTFTILLLMSLSPNQHTVIKGMISGAIASIVVIALCFFCLRFPMPHLADLSDKIAFALSWIAIAGVMLLAGIGRVAGERFFSKSSIDGVHTDSKTAIDVQYIQNTLEQLILFSMAVLALSVQLPSQYLRIIPIVTIWFLFARLCFWLGYHQGKPTNRAFGFMATFFPNVIMLLAGILLFLI